MEIKSKKNHGIMLKNFSNHRAILCYLMLYKSPWIMGLERATATWRTLPADGAPGHVFQNRGGSVREKQKQETGDNYGKYGNNWVWIILI